MSLDIMKSELERRKVEIADIERTIRVLEKAGEDTTALKVQLIQAKNLIARWEKALAEG